MRTVDVTAVMMRGDSGWVSLLVFSIVASLSAGPLPQHGVCGGAAITSQQQPKKKKAWLLRRNVGLTAKESGGVARENH